MKMNFTRGQTSKTQEKQTKEKIWVRKTKDTPQPSLEANQVNTKKDESLPNPYNLPSLEELIEYSQDEERSITYQDHNEEERYHDDNPSKSYSELVHHRTQGTYIHKPADAPRK